VNKRVFILLLVLLAAVPLLGHEHVTRLATTMLIFAIATLSLDLLVGYGGMISFGHGAFYGIGAYATAVLALQGIQAGIVVFPVAILGAGVVAAAIGAISLLTSGTYFIMITHAFAQMLYYGSVVLIKFGGDEGIAVPRSTFSGWLNTADPLVFFYVVFAIFVGAYLLCRRIVRSRFGRTIRAIKDNERRMISLGYNTYAYKFVAFAFAGALCGLAGALHANLNEYASPSAFHWILSADLLVMNILGGAGTLTGALIGACALLTLQHVLSAYTNYWALILGPVLLGIVLFSKGGLPALIARIAGSRA
jgi:branched-chain amino acid transport system permease protein